MKKTFLILFWLIAACGPPAQPKAPSASPEATHTLVPTAAPTTTAEPSNTPPPTRTTAPTATATAADTPTTTLTATPAATATSTATGAPAVLRGTVLERSNCRYGAGWAYLYKYGLLIGNYLEIIGRNENATWIQVRAIGGANPCWVKASLLDVEGDVTTLPYIENRLPFSPYYGALSGVWAEWVTENEVLISWNPMRLRAGDDSGQYLYLVEAWVCRGGEIVFLPIGVYEAQLRVVDEPGCAEPSHARVYGVEKHGYTWWMKVPWPERR